MTDPARVYRHNTITSATPLGLVLMLYDAAITSLDRASQAAQAGQIESRTKATNHILSLVGELESALNADRGGEVAETLKQFYASARSQLIVASVENSAEKFQQIRAQFASLRDAWQQVETVQRAGAQPPLNTPVDERPPMPSHPTAASDERRPSRWSA
jgi:flagellar protein FliS